MSNSKSHFYSLMFISLRMKWILKLLFDQNSIIISHNDNDNFRGYIILKVTQKGHKNNLYYYSLDLIFMNICFEFLFLLFLNIL